MSESEVRVNGGVVIVGISGNGGRLEKFGSVFLCIKNSGSDGEGVRNSETGIRIV